MKTLHIPSLLRGAGRLLDLGGTLDKHEDYEPTYEDEAVYDALRGDWAMLGNDLRAVIEQERQDSPTLQNVRQNDLSDAGQRRGPMIPHHILATTDTSVGVAGSLIYMYNARSAMIHQGQYVLSHNVEAEQVVLGSLLLDPAAISTITHILQPGDFYAEAHRIIFDVMADLYGRHQPTGYATLAAEMDRRDVTHLAGGRGYLPRLAAMVSTAIHVQYYAEIVSRLAIFRRLIEAGQRITALGADGSISSEEALEDAEAELLALANQPRFTHEFPSIGSIAATYRERTTASLAVNEKQKALEDAITDAISQAEANLAQANETVNPLVTP